MAAGRAGQSASLLPGGDVLVAGGQNRFGDTATAEIFGSVMTG
jgi:hypothetical protein